MSSRIPFQYSILRYMHDIATSEFLNIGLVLYSPQASYFKAELLLRYQRVSDTFPGLDGEFFRSYVGRLQTLLDQQTIRSSSSQIALLTEPQRKLGDILREILPTDDSSIQFSPVMPGLTDNLDQIYAHLYDRLVERYAGRAQTISRDDEEVWNGYRRRLQEAQVLQYLGSHAIKTRYETFAFEHTWKNGAWNVLQPISLDLAHAQTIRTKARQWVGALAILNGVPDLGHLYMLLGHPQREDSELQKAYKNARALLREYAADRNIEIVEEDEADKFIRRIKPLVEEHSEAH
jgi:Protein of unknown function (DUF3037)